MTIREAVALEAEISNKITQATKLIRALQMSSYHPLAMGTLEIDKQLAVDIALYLKEYIELLDKKLEEEFK